MWDVTQATLIAMIMYAVPAWWGFLSVAQKDRIASVVKKAKRYGYLPSDCDYAHTLVECVESKLFNSVLSNPHHVLYHLLPPVNDIGYNLRQQSYSLTLSSEDSKLIRKNFLHRMFFQKHLSGVYTCVIVLSSSFYSICCQLFISHCTCMYAVMVCICQMLLKKLLIYLLTGARLAVHVSVIPSRLRSCLFTNRNISPADRADRL